MFMSYSKFLFATDRKFQSDCRSALFTSSNPAKAFRTTDSDAPPLQFKMREMGLRIFQLMRGEEEDGCQYTFCLRETSNNYDFDS